MGPGMLVGGEVTGTLRAGVPRGRGGESRLVSNRCPRAARKMALKNRQAGGFEVVERLKIRLLGSGAMVVKLETLPTTAALGERSANWSLSEAWVLQAPPAPCFAFAGLRGCLQRKS